ncbi:hypothetical protein BC831DRAFT_462545, partial [Entophlyctis helioformis]
MLRMKQAIIRRAVFICTLCQSATHSLVSPLLATLVLWTASSVSSVNPLTLFIVDCNYRECLLDMACSSGSGRRCSQALVDQSSLPALPNQPHGATLSHQYDPCPQP